MNSRRMWIAAARALEYHFKKLAAILEEDGASLDEVLERVLVAIRELAGMALEIRHAIERD